MRRCLCYTKMSVAVKHKCRFIFYILCKFFHATNKKQGFWYTIKCKNWNGDLHRHAAFLLAGWRGVSTHIYYYTFCELSISILNFMPILSIFCVVEQITNMNFVRFAMNTMDLILKLLKENNKEQKELCDFIGIRQQIFTDWKSGRLKSYLKHIEKIALFFNVSTDYLLGLSEDKENADPVKEVSVDELLSLYDGMTDAQKAEFIIKFNEFINERRR